MEWENVCLTVTFPCPGGNQVLTTLTTSSFDSTSFRGQHLSGVWRGESLKVISQGCELDAVTLSIQVVLRLPELWCWGETLRYAEVTFHTGSCQAEHIGNISTFFSACWYVCLSLNCYSSLHHIKENHSFTFPVHCHHHVSGWWRTLRSCAFPTSPSLALFCPVTYTAPIDCNIAINIAEPFMNVSHHFFHCNKEVLLQHAVCSSFLW